MSNWYSTTTTPPAAHEDVLVGYYPTAGGQPCVDIAFRLHNDEWRLSRNQLRIRPIVWQPKPELPETLAGAA